MNISRKVFPFDRDWSGESKARCDFSNHFSLSIYSYQLSGFTIHKMTEISCSAPMTAQHGPLDVADFQDWLRLAADTVSFLWDAYHCIFPWTNSYFGNAVGSVECRQAEPVPHSCVAFPVGKADDQWPEHQLFLRDMRSIYHGIQFDRSEARLQLPFVYPESFHQLSVASVFDVQLTSLQA